MTAIHFLQYTHIIAVLHLLKSFSLEFESETNTFKQMKYGYNDFVSVFFFGNFTNLISKLNT